MTLKEIREFVPTVLRECALLSEKKAKDYGVDNFVDTAAFMKATTGVNIDPCGVALVELGIKLTRINELASKSGKPENESIQDSFRDAIVYMALAYREYERSRRNDETNREENTADGGELREGQSVGQGETQGSSR